MNKVNLNKFNNSNYKPAGKLKIILWYFTNMFLFKIMLPNPSSIKVRILKLFGGAIGSAVVIKPNVNIKYPWLLSIGDNCWIGENVWIDNLARVTIENNVFIGSNTSLVAPLIIGRNSVIGAGSVITKNVPSNSLAIERTEQQNFKKK